jgi:GTPase SAR1 family protein
VGKTDGGKSTLLRRLSSQSDKIPGKTVGIDIRKFSYPKHRGRMEPVQFIVWDFAGEVLHMYRLIARQ